MDGSNQFPHRGVVVKQTNLEAGRRRAHGEYKQPTAVPMVPGTPQEKGETRAAMIPNRTTSAHRSRQTPYKKMAFAIVSAQHYDHMARVV